jgi:SAM-dependent methyltransferase
MSTVSEEWQRDHPWAVVYRRLSRAPLVAWPVGRLAFGLDVRELDSPLALIEAVPEGGAVLDVPCGPGNALRGLQPGRDVRYVAADISPAMLARTAQVAGERGLHQVQAREADVESLPFADGEFDLVLTLLGLHCVPDPARAVVEMGRVVKPGGTLAGTIFLMDGGLRYWGVRQGGRALGVLGPSGGMDDLRCWLGDAGLEVEEVTRLGTLARFRARRPAG